MKVYQIEFDYIWQDGESKEKKLQVRRQSKEICGLLEDMDENGRFGYKEREPIINQMQLLALTELNEDFKILRTLDVGDPLGSSVERFEKAVAKLSQIPVSDIAYNERCEVHVPNMALMTYNETMLLEDSCTDALQDRLDEGWRIIAACPQPQRRPDYIMGRYNPNRDVDRLGGGAKRGNY